MKGFTLMVSAAFAALAASALLSGCSTDPQKQGDAFADASYTPVGTYIPRKKSSGSVNNGGTVDMQSLENARNNGNGTINLPTK
jgi:lactam utilization protein B